MTWWDLRRLLRNLSQAVDRWWLVEAIPGSGQDRWHTLAAYTDLTVARPGLPAGAMPPAPRAVTVAVLSRRLALRCPWQRLFRNLADHERRVGIGPSNRAVYGPLQASIGHYLDPSSPLGARFR